MEQKVASELITAKSDLTLSEVTSIFENIKNQTTSESIWRKIEPTQERWNSYTLVPKSFKIQIDDKQFWVNPNASKHMMELTSPLEKERSFFDTLRCPWDTPAKENVLSHELILNDFHDVLKIATKDGILYNKEMLINNWELEIRLPNISNGLPTVVHARRIK